MPGQGYIDLGQGVHLLTSVVLTIYKLISICFFAAAACQLSITMHSVLQARPHITLHHSWRVVACLLLSVRHSVLPHFLRVLVVGANERRPELEQRIPDPCALSLACLVLAVLLHGGLKLALACHALYAWAGVVTVPVVVYECLQ